MSTLERPTRDALLRAAHELLVSEGPAAVTIRRVAAGANSTTMTIYSQFGGKDGIIDELFVEGFRVLQAALQAVGPSADPVDDLRRGAAAYRHFALENTAYYSLTFQRPIP